MTFDELIDIRPNIRVADIIQLFLMGYDNKIYLNLAKYENSFPYYILKNKRIIDDEWIEFYECKVTGIEQEETWGNFGFLTLFIE